MSSTTTAPVSPFRVIGILSVAAFVVILNETIMSVALPRLMDEFNITEATVQWVTTAFMLTMAVVIPTTGWILTRFHLRNVYVVAMLIFTAGTLVAALAPTFLVLVMGRVVQAIGTAIMMPLLMTTVMNMVPFEKRGRTMGIVGMVISAAPALGPTTGGIILEHFDWRWMFWAVLPIAVLVLLVGRLMLSNVTETRYMKLDVVSVILSALGFSGLIYGLSSLGETARGVAQVPFWIPLIIGAVSLIIFVLRQLSLRENAFLNIRVFAVPTYTFGMVLMITSNMAMFGTFIVLPIYIQQVLGFDAQVAGLVMLPSGVLMGVLGIFVGRIFDAIGARPLLIPGSIIGACGLWGMTTLDVDSALWSVVLWNILMAVGIGMLMGPIMTSALSSLPGSLYQHGSAIFSTLQQVAAAGGTALYITVMSVAAVVGAGRGEEPLAAQMTGMHNALIWGALLMLIPVVGSFFFKAKPYTEKA
ncbi:MAG: DHA2 family efflux MFS transporter permease subunit [Yaniella sp.]|nr:DHA2 family efflux MFS transporter permease subunit [Yaniella sp.]